LTPHNALILHHYPQSPVAEKVRTVLGIKGLKWYSVEIPRLPPKPDLVPLTGGYRRTPVLQIGADIYCDSHCIIRQLDQRYPNPSLFPQGPPALSWVMSKWTDEKLFTQCIALVLGAAENLPAEFAADRGRLYFGQQFKIESLQNDTDFLLSQITAQFGLFSQMLGNQAFLDGQSAGLKDVLAHYLVWFVVGRYAGGAGVISRYNNLIAWQQRMQSIGQGHATDLPSSEALNVARDSQPQARNLAVDINRAGLTVGQAVQVIPDGDGGDPAVCGALLNLDDQRISLRRHSVELGNTVVHFPFDGYRCESVIRADRY
jgi:glutathione S-transferase